MREIKAKKLFLTAALAGAAFLMIYPCRMLLAEYYSWKASFVLEDPDTDYRRQLDINAETMHVYREALALLEKCAEIVPSRAVHFIAVSEIYVRLGKWAENMGMMKELLPREALTREEAFKKAEENLQIAITRDPLNPDYRLALADYYRTPKTTGKEAEIELELAIKSAPMNVPLRYNVALRYLLSGNNTAAIRHATVLAQLDESYHVSRIADTYLFKSFEIAWRASEKKVETVKSVVPDNPDGEQALMLFLQWKGIE